MKNLILAIFLGSSLHVFSQPTKDSFITVKYDIDTVDAMRIYNGLLEIDVSKFYIPSLYSKYHCDLIIEEYYEGKLVKKQDYLDSIPELARFAFNIKNYLKDDRFEIAFYSQKRDTSLKLYGVIGGAGLKCEFRLKQKQSYSWKEVYDLQFKKYKLQAGKQFPLMVYTTAVSAEHSKYGEGTSEFCRISGELIPYQNWYKELGLKHYFLFFIKLVE